MIFCVCKNVSENHIKELSSKGFSLQEIKSKTGMGTKCGSCVRSSSCTTVDLETRSELVPLSEIEA